MNIRRTFFVAALLVAVGAMPAMAVHFTDITLDADCDGYMVTYSGQTFPWESVDITFTISLTDMGGTVIDDVEMVNVPVDNSGDPSVFGGVYYGTWDAELCGMYTVDGVARVELYNNPEPGNSLTWGESMLDGGELDCSCEEGNPGTGTPGFWMNHPCAWPVEFITFDRIYSKAEAIMLMKHATRRDKTYSMFQALVAAKLNVAIGNEYGCVEDALEEAELWMIAHPVGSGVRASSRAWKAVEGVHDMLDDYNNGRLCAPHRDDVDGGQVVCKPDNGRRRLFQAIKRVITRVKEYKNQNGNKNGRWFGKVALGDEVEEPVAFPTVQNYPNPFNPVTTIQFTVPAEGTVTVEIYNSIGEKVETLVDGFYQAGTHAIDWNASSYSSGTYFSRMITGEHAITNKLMLLK